MPEISYRRASTLYAMRHYEPALTEINQYLSKYSHHQRWTEAQVLKGDILMGQGELMAAVKLFNTIVPESQVLFHYSIFQIGKIYRVLEDYKGLINHFEWFIHRGDISEKQRVCEALYWIGWAYARQEKTSKAFPLFIDALQTYGNKIEANEVMEILKALDDLHQRSKHDSGSKIVYDHPLLTTWNFETWLEAEVDKAFTANKLTYYSRLKIYLSDRREKQKRINEAHVLLMEIAKKVPLEYLDAEGLGRTGLILEKLNDPSTEERLNMLLGKFPSHPQRALAYYGLGRVFIKTANYAQALSYLERLDEELPGHPLATESAFMRGSTLTKMDHALEAIPIYDRLLHLKSARGRNHARALQGLAEAQLSLGHQDKAVAYYQRIYTLYRAYSELVADAYLQSAKIFETMGDLPAAFNTLEEMLNTDTLITQKTYPQAQIDRNRLAAMLPIEKTSFPGVERLP